MKSEVKGVKKIEDIVKGPQVKYGATFIGFVCYCLAVITCMTVVLTAAGKLNFIFYDKSGMPSSATFNEKNYDPSNGGFSMTMKDEVRIWANDENEIDAVTKIALVLVAAAGAVPSALAYFFLGKVFYNVAKGDAFTEKNSSELIKAGVLKLAAVVLAPFAKVLICFLSNLISTSRIQISAAMLRLGDVIMAAAIITAGYVIRRGAELQEEADHTL